VFSPFSPFRPSSSVNRALKSVAQILEVHRRPQLAEHVDHTYDDKYTLVDALSNVAIIAQINVLAGLGLTAEMLKNLSKEQANRNRSITTLRFQASESVTFEKMENVRIGSGNPDLEVMETGRSGGGGGRRSILCKIMKRAKEYHWRVTTEWEISMYSGTKVEERIVLQSRSVSRKIVTQLAEPAFSKTKEYPPLETALDFLLRHIEGGEEAQFQVDRNVSKTPRRNGQVDTMLKGVDALAVWTDGIARHFDRNVVQRFLFRHNPIHKKQADAEETGKFKDLVIHPTDVFCPLQPLMEECMERSFVEVAAASKDEEAAAAPRGTALALPDRKKEEEDSPVLSSVDYLLLLEQQLGSLEEKSTAQQQSYPKKDANKFISQIEAEVVLCCKHSSELGGAYRLAVEYVEHMLRTQLISAIGKEVDQSDIDKFVKYNNSKLLAVPPQPFCHVVRRPEHSPEGMLCIEGSANGTSEEFEPIETFARESNCGSIKVPLDAAASLELKGRVMLHGWLRHPFQGTNDSYQLTARARQFSCFVLMIGTMTSGLEFQPKDALIVRNKDEVIIPLLLKDIPSPKEFKDAIRSLSPEQQRFAKAFRGMQLGSSVFGVCVVQIKPQLEKLLGLPADSLTKEMKLTQDLIELFIEYQVPSDMLSFDGNPEEDSTAKAMVDNVKCHVGSVMNIIENARNKQLGAEVKNCIARNTIDSLDYPSVSKRGNDFLHASIDRELDRARQKCYVPDDSAAYAASYEEEGYCGTEEWDDQLEVALVDDDFDDEDECISDRSGPNSAPHGEAGHSLAAGKGEDKETTESTELDSIITKRGIANIDFTSIPKRLNEAFSQLDKTGSLRSSTIKTGTDWRRKRQENLLVEAVDCLLNSDGLKSETNKALDLLDALSRSGTLPIETSELHVVVAASHRFENDVMGTVIEDNVNPIEKLEKSTLTVASSVHGEYPDSLVRDPVRLRQLASSFPDLLTTEETTKETIHRENSGDGDLAPARPDGWLELSS
jgi:hypothetical protein